MTEKKDKKAEKTERQITPGVRAVPIFLFALGIFLALCFIVDGTGALGNFVSRFLLGLFSYAAYCIPLLIFLHAVFYVEDYRRGRRATRLTFTLVFLFTFATLIHGITYFNQDYPFSFSDFYRNGQAHVGGGAIGGLLAFAVVRVFGSVGLIIIALMIIAIYLTYFFTSDRSKFRAVWLAIASGVVSFFSFIEKKIKESKQRREEERIARENETKQEKFESLFDDDYVLNSENNMSDMNIPQLGIREAHAANMQGDEPFRFADEPVRPREEIKRRPSDIHAQDPFGTDAQDTVADQLPENDFAGAGDGDRADDVFSDRFSSFDIAANMRLSGKLSSRTEKETEAAGIKERLDSVSLEEEVKAAARARRESDFERKKQEALRRMKETGHVYDRAARTETETTAQPSKTPYTAPQTTYERPAYKANATPAETQPAQPAYTEPKTTYTAPQTAYTTPKTTYAPPAPTPSPAPAREPEPERTVPPSQPAPTPAAPKKDEPLAFTFGHDHGEEEKKAGTPSPALTFDFSAPAAPKAETNEKKEAPFFFTDTPVDNTSTQRPNSEETTLNVDRTMLNPTPHTDAPFDVFSPDEEEKEPETPEIIEPVTENILPPEDETPTGGHFVIDGKTDVPEDEEEEDNFFPDEPEEADDMPDEEEDGYEDGEDEDDIPPFDMPVVPPERPVYDQPVREKPKEKTQDYTEPDYSDYKYPPIDLLKEPVVDPDGHIEEENQENAEKLQETLRSFGVDAIIRGYDRGPRITRYEIVPAKGVRVNKIVNLFDDITLALAAKGIRMEAPIPGRTAVGVEIPNKKPQTVYLRDLIEDSQFSQFPSKTVACIGKDVTGNSVYGDIGKMPHLLVAGATGMGKSVCVNSMLISILFHARPDEVKLIIFDPKKVDFQGFNGIPHMLVPVVTDPKNAAGALMWAVDEMEKRYEMIEKAHVKKIDDYNAKCRENPALGKPLPKIIIVIDELADLMLQVKNPVEMLIQRIAQKARAAGIHLIIGTQRPQVSVLTGLIKANIPSRIACKVQSNIDSRTILEVSGAEKLLNNGDMLYFPAGAEAPLRVQGAFVSDGEMDAVMDYLRTQAKGEIYDPNVLAGMEEATKKCSKDDSDSGDGDSEYTEDGTSYFDDPKFLEVVDVALSAGKVSTSLLQRRCGIGYGKAARYIDVMEDQGIVSEPNGTKPRDVLMTKQEWNELRERRSLT